MVKEIGRPKLGAASSEDPDTSDTPRKSYQYQRKLPTLPDVVRNYDGSLENFNNFLANILTHLSEAAWPYQGLLFKVPIDTSIIAIEGERP